MRQALLLVLVAATACATETGSETTAALATGFVHRSGTTLVGVDGHPLVMRGLNLGAWLNWEGWMLGGNLLGTGNSQTAIATRLAQLYGAGAVDQFRETFRDGFITEADLAHIAELGFNSVRVPFNHHDLDFARLDHVIDWGAAHGVYIVLDLHSAPGGQCNEFPDDPDPVLLWDDPAAQAATIALWKQIATRYKDRHWVAGYDLLNEPCKGSNAALAAFDKQLVTAIRSVDRDHLVIVEGNNAATDFGGFTSRLDENMMYSFHFYNFLGDNRVQKFTEYAALARAQQVPLWCGELGEADVDFIRSTIGMLSDPQYGVTGGWSLWTYKRAPTANATLEETPVPDAWKKVMAWVTAPLVNPKPGWLVATIGKAQYLATIPLAANHERGDLLDALLQ
ncbi:MAG TPA: cellulase family glycosylhydrolase [Kofleriaceae bacterium]